jgi:hypothetical protein
MDRRSLLRIIPALPFAKSLLVESASQAAAAPFSRMRPGDPNWPSEEAWAELARWLDGQLIKIVSPLSACMGASPSEAQSCHFWTARLPRRGPQGPARDRVGRRADLLRGAAAK